MPIPCPECGAATPVADEDEAAEEEAASEPGGESGGERVASTAHGLPGNTGGEGDESGASTSKEHPKAGRDSTLMGVGAGDADDRSAESTGPDEESGSSDDDQADPDGTLMGTGPAEGPQPIGTVPTAKRKASEVGGSLDESGADEDETTDDEHAGAPSLDPGAPGARDEAPETDDEDHPDEETREENGEEESEREGSGGPSLDPGDRWSTPPPQEAIESEEDQHGAVTEEMDSVPEILADADSSQIDSEEPEPAYEKEPEGTSLLEQNSEGEAVPAEESAPEQKAEEQPDDETTPPAEESEEPVEAPVSESAELGAAEAEAEDSEAVAEIDESEEPDGADETGDAELEEAREDEEEEEEEEEEDETADADETDEVEEPERVRDPDAGYRIDPSTDLEIAADEAMARATEQARRKSPVAGAERRTRSEIRSSLPDASYRVRVENYVYTDIRRDRLAELLADGKVFAIDALARDDGPWETPRKHPALDDFRSQLADDAHKMLDAAPESNSREIDLDEIEKAGQSEETPPPVPGDPSESERPEAAAREEKPRRSRGELTRDRPAERTAAEAEGEHPRPSTQGGDSLLTKVAFAIAGLLFLLAGLIVVVTLRERAQSNRQATSGTTAKKATTDDEKPSPSRKDVERVQKAVARASGLVAEATSVEVDDPELQKKVADRLRRNGEPRRASRIFDALWRERSDDREFARRYLELLVEAERWKRVRHVAVRGIQSFDETEPFEQKFRATLEKDPTLGEYRPIDLGDHEGVHSIRPADKGDYPAYAIRGMGDEQRFLFVPGAIETESWRDQIAAWRLCRLLECGFTIPETRAATIARSDFERLFEQGPAESPAPKRSQLEWIERDGTEILRGAVRRWPTGLQRWPIEATEVWREWVAGYVDESAWNETVAEAVGRLDDERLDPDLRRRVLETTGDWTVGETARQLSNILTFDYLTNNWGRFEEEPSRYGASHHVAGDRFVTLRSETVFQGRGSRRVEGRFNWCFRFSRDLATSLELLERERAASILYPAPTPLTRAKMQIFWRQRKRFLNRLEFLADKFGRDRILAFQ